MKRIEDQIYQFKIVLLDTKPPIWRRIQVPADYTFWDLHVAIQDAMGWEDCHLHQFEFGDSRTSRGDSIGLPDNESPFELRHESLIDWDEHIANWFTPDKSKCKYWYDFGDDWWHTVTLEKILPSESRRLRYPRCIAGKRACPPEDCGGPWGYADLLEILQHPDDPHYNKIIDWIGNSFDPEYFTPSQVVFDDPKGRLKNYHNS